MDPRLALYHYIGITKVLAELDSQGHIWIFLYLLSFEEPFCVDPISVKSLRPLTAICRTAGLAFMNCGHGSDNQTTYYLKDVLFD
jgi:hypothetical protein